MLKQIFSDIRILDFTQVISGSYVTTILGDMGAEIIKVEPPIHGESLRLTGPMYKNESGFFVSTNRNKKSISVNLKDKEGIKLIKELIPHCGVVTQNFKPGVMAKMGLAYDDLKKIKKDIIYLSVSGYGYNNRYTDRPAYDNVIQAETGLAALNGLIDNDQPLRSPLSVSDYAAGMYGAFALSSAIYHHKNTGEGQNIDVAMYDSLISIMDNSFLFYDKMRDEINKVSDKTERDNLLAEKGLKNSGNRHPGAAPHSYYRTKDGYLAHMSLSNKMWDTLLSIIGREDLTNDPKYKTLEGRRVLWREIDQIIEQWTTLKTTDEIMAIFKEKKLPCGKVRTIDEVFDDPHSDDREIFREVVHPIAGKVKVTNLPIKFSKTPSQIKKASPLLGEDNFQVLTDLLHYSSEQIKSLHDKGVLYQQKLK